MLLYLLLYLFIGFSVGVAAHEEYTEGFGMFLSRALLWPLYVVGRTVVIFLA